MRRPIFLLFSLLPSLLFAEPLAMTVKAEAALLMNADTGVILYEKDAYSRYNPASVTKIATAAYALKECPDKLNVMIAAEHDCIAWLSEEAKKRSNYTTPAYWLEPGGSHIGIKKGEELSFKDLLMGMMIASGDDASNVVAQYVGGTVPAFMDQVNAYMQALGCTATHYTNPHGLYHPDHYTTAYDLAIMTREALKNPLFAQMVATERYTRPKTNKQEATTLVQTNRLLRRGKYHYSKAIGVKTGYISAAQNTLVAAAKDGDRTLIAVLLKVKDRGDIFLEAAKMFDTAFEQPKVQRTLLKKGKQKFTLELASLQAPVPTYLPADVTSSYYPAEEPKIKCLLAWDTLAPPIAKGQRLGELRFLENDKIAQTVSLYAFEGVDATWKYWFEQKFSSLAAGKQVWMFICLLLALLFGVWALPRLRRV